MIWGAWIEGNEDMSGELMSNKRLTTKLANNNEISIQNDTCIVCKPWILIHVSAISKLDHVRMEPNIMDFQNQ